MSNFKTLAVASILAITGVIGFTQKADAYEVRSSCGQIRGFSTCVSYQDRNSPDIIYVNGPNGKSTISIRCFGDGSYKWNGYGPNGQAFDSHIAKGFCFD